MIKYYYLSNYYYYCSQLPQQWETGFTVGPCFRISTAHIRVTPRVSTVCMIRQSTWLILLQLNTCSYIYSHVAPVCVSSFLYLFFARKKLYLFDMECFWI